MLWARCASTVLARARRSDTRRHVHALCAVGARGRADSRANDSACPGSRRRRGRQIRPGGGTGSQYSGRSGAAVGKVVSGSIADFRSTIRVFISFAAAAILLAAIGIYGLVSYWVTQRTYEIGVRVAIGATRKRIVSMILAQGLRVALYGIVAGMIAALAVTRFLASLLYGVQRHRSADVCGGDCSGAGSRSPRLPSRPGGPPASIR